MVDRHEPDSQFVENLEWQISSELRRQMRNAPAPNHALRRFARAATMVIVSIAFGAVAMAASQQIEESWRKELLASSLEVRLELARQRVEMARQEFERIERQYEVGTVDDETLAMAGLQLADIEAHARTLELELEEVQITGREPAGVTGRESVGELSSPLVDGRDFVSERIRVQMDVVARQLDIAVNALERARQRVEIGVQQQRDLWAVEMMVAQHEAQLELFETRLEIRRAFLEGELSAVETELRLLEAEAEERGASMQQQLALAVREKEYFERMAAVGTISPFELTRAEMRVAEIEAEIQLAELEMELVRREIQARRQR